MNLALTVTLLGSLMGLVGTPATQPAPVVQGPPVVAADEAPPATTPAPSQVAATAQPLTIRTVAVFPLAWPRNDPRFTWIARGVQEDLISSLTAIPGMQAAVLRGDTPSPSDDAAAVAAASKLGASLAVYGQYQLMDPNVRLVVTVADVNTNKVIGSVRATGAIHDLAKLEDVVGQQVQQLILNPSGTSVAVAGGTPETNAPATQPAPEVAPVPDSQPPITWGPPAYLPPTTTAPPDQAVAPDNGWAYPVDNWDGGLGFPFGFNLWQPVNPWYWGPWWGGIAWGPSIFALNTAPVFFHHFDHRYFHHGEGGQRVAGLGNHPSPSTPSKNGNGPVHRDASAGQRLAPATGIRSFAVTGLSINRSGPPVIAHGENGVGGGFTTVAPGRGVNQPNGRSNPSGSPARPATFGPGASAAPAVREYNFVAGQFTSGGSGTPTGTTESPRLVGGQFFMLTRSGDFTPRSEESTPSYGGHIFVAGRDSGTRGDGYAGISHVYAGPAYEPAYRGSFGSGFHSVAPSFGGESHSFGGGFQSYGMTGGFVGGAPVTANGGGRGGNRGR